MAGQPSSSSSASSPPAGESRVEEKDAAAHKPKQTADKVKDRQTLDDDSDKPNSSSPPLPKERNLPPWLNHFNRRDLTTTLRCTIAAWVALLLTFIHPSLVSLGQTAFLAAVVIFLVPPSGNLIVHIMSALSLLLGMCLAWAWGIATMRAAQSARPAQQTNARLQQLQQQVIAEAQATGRNDTSIIATDMIHNGFMLDARVSVIYFVMSCVFIYLLCRIRFANGKMVLFQMFGFITIDAFLVTGPSLTSWVPSLAKQVVIPAACGVAISVACAILIFPQSTNQQVLGQMQDILTLLNYPIETGRKFAAGSLDVDIQRLKKTRDRVLALYAQVKPSMAFMSLDLSHGRWGGEDVQEVFKKFESVLVAIIPLINVQVACFIHESTTDNLHDQFRPPLIASHEKKDAKPVPRRLRRALPGNIQFINALITPTRPISDDALRGALRGSSVTVLDVNGDAICHLVEALQLVNSNRWWTSKSFSNRLPQLINECKSISRRLAQARQTCTANTTSAGLGIHGKLFDQDGMLKEEFKGDSTSVADLINAFVIEKNIVASSHALENMLTFVTELLEERTVGQFWFPMKFRNMLSWAASSNKPTSSLAAGEGVDDLEGTDDPDRILQQTRDAKRRLQTVYAGQGIHMKRRSLLTRALVGTFSWFTNTAGQYAMRVVVVTIATAIPAVIPHSAGIFSRQRGIWTVFTAQSCMLMYMADFTWSTFTRIVGTILGGIIGMVIWYIGSGNGMGNPYGMAAAVFFGIFIFIWARIWLPPYYVQASGLAAATFTLIIGYSWDTNHLAVYGLPGVGYETFWRRLVMVLIGFAAALIVQMLPSPPSGTLHVAKTLGTTLYQCSDHYAFLVSHWGRADPNGEMRGFRSVITSASLGIGERLFGLSNSILMLRLELTTSPFDQGTLRQVQELLAAINQHLSRLMLAGTTLPMEHQRRLVENAGILEDTSVDNIMTVLSVAEHSLRRGAPLPQRLPVPLLRTCYGEHCARNRPLQLRREYIGSEDFRDYCVALSQYLSFLHSVDELVAVLKTAAGESHIIHDWEGTAEKT